VDVLVAVDEIGRAPDSRLDALPLSADIALQQIAVEPPRVSQWNQPRHGLTDASLAQVLGEIQVQPDFQVARRIP
jgi:hypothetical protein